VDLAFSPDDKAFREEVRDWLGTHAPRERRPRGGTPMREFDLDWQRRKHAGGWSGLSWPEQVGGQGLSLVRQMIWYEEQARAEAPGLGCLSIALNHAGPSVIARGTEAQKSFHLPKILAGEVVWCQGFSEPNAGSDLANLRLAGRIEGDHIVVRGQKLWTSHAQIADFQELLIRTDPSLGRHKGISWVICDMTSPGITVRPINTLAGDQHFCEVFYDDVEIPLTNVVGAVNDGWRVAMTTLTNERGGTTLSHAAELSHVVERLISLAHERTDGNGRSLASNEAIAARLAEHRADAAALRALTYSLISLDQHDASSGSDAAVTFLFYGELLQRVRITGLEVLGAAAVELSGEAEPWTRSWLADRMMVIAGGSVQVRKNIIAERILGLPRSY
jgi:alkylation response protein AidB-like acyl-CoA dehydrogenase